jgi:hypothetical protein
VPAGGSEYTVVCRASSSAHFLPEEGWEHHFHLPGLALGTARTRAFTRWAREGAHPIPRELVIEVKGRAGSLDEAGAKFNMVARPIANMIAFVANVRVGPVEAHLAFDSDSGKTERELLEVFLPDEQGGVGEGRIIRRHLLEVACPASMAMPADSPRLSRALRQYELALREWYVGGEWLALSHLWIAVENLTEAVLRRTKLELSKTDQELAEMLDVVIDDPDRPRWPQIMREQIREQIIFDGDHDTYATAKRASDGLEHGFLELDAVARRAIASADTTFACVRRTIIDLLDLPREIGSELMEVKPKDVQSARKAIRGRLLGAAADPAADGELYPRLEWTSGIGSVVRDGAGFHITFREQITVRTNPAVQFSLDRIEVAGRLADGEPPVQLREDELNVIRTPGAGSAELMNAVMPLVDAVAATGADRPYDGARVMAFNLFGQGVAFFQSAQTLIAGSQPAEALPSLRGLTLIAARFEQMSDPEGPGLGIVPRMAVDSINQTRAESISIEHARMTVHQVADQAGIVIPDRLPDPEETGIYKSLLTEMRLAETASDGGYGIVGLHLQAGPEPGFHTKRQPDSFTDLIASACVMAQLDLLKRAAILFDWSLDATRIDELIAKAITINDAAAQGETSIANDGQPDQGPVLI